MRTNSVNIRKHITGFLLVLCSAFALTAVLGTRTALSADVLYIGDAADNTVKRFDAETGDFLDADADPSNDPDAFVRSGVGGLAGPRGLLFDGNLLVVNQNFNLQIPGAVLRYNGQTGAFQGALIPSSNKNAPFTPRGIVLGQNKVLYVADLTTADGTSPGKVRTYDANGAFLRTLNPVGFPPTEFHPRAVVFGPDGLLYVSVRNLKKDGLGGHVLRFSPEGKFLGVFIADKGGIGQLNRPEGLMFGPDGRLYITSFRANANDTDAIRIYDNSGVFVDKIDLYQVGQPRAFAQALLFGPEGRLFVPITNTGEVRRYEVASKNFAVFVPSSVSRGPLQEPWYLTFGQTDPKTLKYLGSPPAGPNLLRCFCQNGTHIDVCAQLDCFSSAEMDAICGPACAPQGGESGTACFGVTPICATPQPSPRGALGARQPPSIPGL